MASTGNTLPTVAASVDRAGSTAWTSPGNVVSDNATDTTSAVPTDYLVTSGYGFTIPGGSTISGVTVRVEASETGTGASSYIPQLHSATTPTLIGSAKSAVTVTGATKVISSNGGTSDVWGATLTPDIVNNSGFGVSIWSTDTTNTLAIDYVTIAIEYTTPAAVAGSGGLAVRTVRSRRHLKTGPFIVESVATPPATVNVIKATQANRWRFDVKRQSVTHLVYPATPQVFPPPKAIKSGFEYRTQWRPDRVYQVATPQVPPAPVANRIKYQVRLQTVVPLYVDAAVVAVVTNVVVAQKAHYVRFDIRRQDVPLLLYRPSAVVVEEAASKERRYYRSPLEDQIRQEDEIILAVIKKLLKVT